MPAPSPAPPDARRKALEYLWGQYKVWDETSETYRRSLSLWRPLVLLMGVAGGALGALSTEGAVPAAWRAAWAHWDKLDVAGGILLGLAALATREMLSPERERRWVRTRAAAEAFKREAYLMAAKAPPYDGVIVPASLERAEDIRATIGETQEASVGEEKKREGLPRSPMSVDEYVRHRLNEQMTYYRAKAGRHRDVVGRVRAATLLLGALAVALGVLGSRGVPAGVWLAVITAVTTSLAAYLYARRLQYLVVSFLAAARGLEALRAAWDISGRTDADTDERNQLILDCEKILSAENSSWIAEWGRKNSTAAAEARRAVGVEAEAEARLLAAPQPGARGGIPAAAGADVRAPRPAEPAASGRDVS